jgi:hypothetical protein
LRLAGEVAGIRMEPINNEKLDSSTKVLKRMGDTSRCHPLRCTHEMIFWRENVLIAEQLAAIYG